MTMSVGATPIAARAAALPASAAAEPNQLYRSRIERSFDVPLDQADRLQALVAQHVKLDDEFPNPQRVATVYVRPVNKHAPGDDWRIRSYPDSATPELPGGPAFIEFKDKVVDPNGVEVKEKTRAVAPANLGADLLWGTSGAEAIGTAGRTGEDLAVAERAIMEVDEHSMRPLMHGTYNRTTFNDAAMGVRITFDRDVTTTGVGYLAPAGDLVRPTVIMDVKTAVGAEPPWLTSLIDAETGAGNMVPVGKGKGGTGVKELTERLPAFLQLVR